jgi:hypothetical protein
MRRGDGDQDARRTSSLAAAAIFRPRKWRGVGRFILAGSFGDDGAITDLSKSVI